MTNHLFSPTASLSTLPYPIPMQEGMQAFSQQISSQFKAAAQLTCQDLGWSMVLRGFEKVLCYEDVLENLRSGNDGELDREENEFEERF